MYHVQGSTLLKHNEYLSIEWVDYVEEPMKYQALRPHFCSMVGGGVGGVGGEDWGWWVGGCGGGVVRSGWVDDVMGSVWGGEVHLIGKIIFVLRKK